MGTWWQRSRAQPIQVVPETEVCSLPSRCFVVTVTIGDLEEVTRQSFKARIFTKASNPFEAGAGAEQLMEMQLLDISSFIFNYLMKISSLFFSVGFVE
mmetsp:Transcript_32161/g.35635  ORF Transcript_32161/g.35635 Transcript_32161/m.35635 type:complete len:98 (+) Transcript_32161:2743-3036(+)